jgi:putative photosynthetic complex assembly protein
MHEHARDETIPRFLLRSMLAVIVFAFAAIIIAQNTGLGLRLTPESSPVEQRTLLFEDQPAGETIVRDADTGRIVALLEADGDGFIRGVLRGLTRTRATMRVEGEEVFLLTLWEDGRLSIADPATGERFDLNSFGRDNLNAFARLLASREESR